VRKGAGEKAISAKGEFEEALKRTSASRAVIMIGRGSLAEIDTDLSVGATRAQLLANRIEMAIAVAAELARTAHQLAEAEAVRDEKRKPFFEQTRRAQGYAKQVATYPTLAARIPVLFRTDTMVSKLGESAYSRCPRQPGSHVAISRTFRISRAIATAAALKETRLPGFWPPRWSDYSVLDGPDCAIDEDATITAPLLEMCRTGPASSEAVDRCVAQAQGLLISEFGKAVGALRELLRRDAEVSSADRDARYPDGAPIFDPVQFPDG
jgi:hypothetical protein